MLLITTKCLFRHACGKRLINANPCHGIMLAALLGERPPRRQRLMLTREELKLLLAAPMRRRNALAIRILLATAVRSAELYQAKWADVDLDGAQWHIANSKTGAAMDIPLAPVVVDWFRELRALAGHSAYVLPAHSRSRAARHGGDTHLNKDTLREAAASCRTVAAPQRIRCIASDATPATHRQDEISRAAVSGHRPAQRATVGCTCLLQHPSVVGPHGSSAIQA
jgi:integrase